MDDLLDFDLDINLDLDYKPKQEKELPQEKPKAKVYTRGTQRHHTRRLTSELALENELPWHFEAGNTYHCISGGDVDSLTYLRSIVKQQKIQWCMLSTWCMAITDLEEIRDWMRKGYIGRVDFYVGEIFPNSYREIFEFLKRECIQPEARVAVFRNHSKIMAGYGERFDFVIESSANVNTNPRTEQATISIDTGLVDFYKEFFDGIVSFERDFDNWKPYTKE